MSDFTTFREGSLHAALKARYAGTIIDAQVEADVDGFIVDVAGRDELVEIQTASFASARRKLERLVAAHHVVLVHPIPVEKWLVRVDASGSVLGRRRSPRHGLGLDLFDELVHIPGLVAQPGFRIDLLLTCEEEIRGQVPAGARYRYPRDWWRLDRRLLKVVETRRIDTGADLLGLLPSGLPEPFTTADIVASSGRSRRLAMRAVYCLERSGAVERLDRRGRFVTYRRTPLTAERTHAQASHSRATNTPAALTGPAPGLSSDQADEERRPQAAPIARSVAPDAANP